MSATVGICFRCGCTDEKPCGPEPCSWANAEQTLCSKCAITCGIHQESISSAAIDGARISAFLALSIILSDPEILPKRKVELVAGMSEAMAALDFVRARFPVFTTSVHIVGA